MDWFGVEALLGSGQPTISLHRVDSIKVIVTLLQWHYIANREQSLRHATSAANTVKGSWRAHANARKH